MSLVAICRLASQDADRCVEVAKTVGWTTAPDAWRAMLSLGDGAGAQLDDGSLAGTVVVISFGEALATIAMMLVRPAHQRQGIGRRLMEHALAASKSQMLCLYATAAGQGLYRPFGFVDAGSSTRFEGPPTEAPPAPHPCARRMGPSDFDTVLEMDRAAQGATRDRLLGSLVERNDGAWVVERDGRICGFGIAKSDREIRRLGPLVAPRDDDAIAIADRLAVGAARARLDLEPGEQALRAWAQARGMREAETSLRMTRGPGELPGARAHSRLLAGRPYG